MASAIRSVPAELDFEAILERLDRSSPEKAREFAALVNARWAYVGDLARVTRDRMTVF